MYAPMVRSQKNGENIPSRQSTTDSTWSGWIANNAAVQTQGRISSVAWVEYEEKENRVQKWKRRFTRWPPG
jgi:hypothetical protein